jgi:hypothetical protein
LRTRLYQGRSASGFFNLLGKHRFSSNNQFRGPSKNKRGTRAFQALEGGGGGPFPAPPKWLIIEQNKNNLK